MDQENVTKFTIEYALKGMTKPTDRIATLLKFKRSGYKEFINRKISTAVFQESTSLRDWVDILLEEAQFHFIIDENPGLFLIEETVSQIGCCIDLVELVRKYGNLDHISAANIPIEDTNNFGNQNLYLNTLPHYVDEKDILSEYRQWGYSLAANFNDYKVSDILLEILSRPSLRAFNRREQSIISYLLLIEMAKGGSFYYCVAGFTGKKANAVKEKTVEADLQNSGFSTLFTDGNYYKRAIDYLKANNFISNPKTLNWIDKTKGYKETIISILKTFSNEGFFNRQLSNDDYVLIANMVFSVALKIDTAKKTHYYSVNIPPV